MKLTDVFFEKPQRGGMAMPESLRKQIAQDRLAAENKGLHPLAVAVDKARGKPYVPPPERGRIDKIKTSPQARARAEAVVKYLRERGFQENQIAQMAETYVIQPRVDVRKAFANEAPSKNIQARPTQERSSMESRFRRYKRYENTYGPSMPGDLINAAVDRDIENYTEAARRGMGATSGYRPPSEQGGVFENIRRQDQMQRMNDINMAFAQMRVTSVEREEQNMKRRRPGGPR